MRDYEEERIDRRKGVKPRRECEWPDCTNLNIGGYRAYCGRHHAANKKAGLPTKYHADKPAKVGRYHNKVTGYWTVWIKDHPLAGKGGYVYEHRAVAFAKYGDGIQTCHWCSAAISWSETDVDHLDWNRSNNVPDNVVTACNRCNAIRVEPVIEKPRTIQRSSLFNLAMKNRD